MSTALIVPVMKNFVGFANLMHSINTPVVPMIIDNWRHNIGVGPAWNVGLQRAVEEGHEFAAIVNDDVVLPPGAISDLTARLTSDTVVASPQNVTGLCHPRGLNFWCFVVRPREFVSRFGLFDENFAPAYFEDDDMAYRINIAGGSILTTEISAWHQVMGTQGMDEPIVTPSLWSRNEDYYRRKWGGAGGQESYKTPFNDPNKTIKDW